MTTMKGIFLDELTFTEFFEWLKKENISLFELKELVLQQDRRKYASIEDWMNEVEHSIYTQPFLDFAHVAKTSEEIDEVHRDILRLLRQDFVSYSFWHLYLGNAKKAIAELWQIPSLSLPVLKDIYRAYLMMNILEGRGKLNKEYLRLWVLNR